MKYKFRPPKPQINKKWTTFLSIKSFFRSTRSDVSLLFCVAGLLLFGWVMVYSSSALLAESRFQDQYFFLKRHILWTLVGIAAFIVSSNISISFWQYMAKPIYFFTVVALVAVLFFGPEIGGAHRWLRFGPFGFQPSELAKLSMVLILADYLDRRQSRILDFNRGLLPILFIFGLQAGLIFVEPDLGTPFLMGLVFVSILIVGGARWKHILGLVSVASLLFLGSLFQFKYRVARLFAYLDPWSDPRGAGYQLVQSLIAMGSGGILGRGLGNSKVKISNLPDPHTDFIFSVIGEELGLWGTLLCVGLFMYICLMGLKIAKSAPDSFSQTTAAGISLMVGYQGIINMGVACGLLPTKGMPLPFLSFGGSSIVILMISMGILIHISRSTRVAALKNRK